MSENGAKKYKFDAFLLDIPERRLTRAGQPVVLSSRAFDLLVALVENGGRLVGKEELYKRVWSDAIVEDANLSVQIAAIRKALGSEYIDTVKGHGYRFTGDARYLNGTDEFQRETKSFSRITIEHETDERNLSSTGRRWNRMRTVVFAGLAVTAGFGLGGYLWRSGAFTDSRSAVERFQSGSIKRLTSTGRVAYAATISPDGKLFAFAQFDGELQSLWVGHVGGGEPMQVRPPAETNYRCVRFAPDGGSLFFTLGESGLHRMPVFGGAAELVNKDVRQSVSFSPDGKRFAFVRNRGAEPGIVIARTDGGEETVIGSPPTALGFEMHSVAWSPDGSTIAVSAPVNDNGTVWEVFEVDVATGAVKPITSNSWSDIDSVSWFGDGQAFVAVSASRLWHVAYPSGEVRPLTNDLGIYSFAIGLSVSGGELAATQVQQYSNIWIAPADDLAEARQVTFGSLGRADGWSGIDWTADGKLVYTAVVDNKQTIWSMDSDGKNETQITPSTRRDFHPSVTDDGRTMVFASTQGGKYAIWRARTDGGEMRKLTDSDIAAQPHISPDGKWVVYISSRESFGTPYRIPSEGGEPVQLTKNNMAWVRVSPDSRFVAGAYQDEGKTKLAIIPLDGGEPVKTFDVPRLANFRLGVRWTPDGRAVTYRDWTNGIWKQSIDGGEPERIAGLPEEKLYAYAWSRDGKQFAYARGREIRDVVLLSKGN